ncbi:SIMPL domain-containing protein [Streptomyces sp. NPDC090075]|uniref:SIMPL domain-containing protein n=1 Tax=Streptomyces sp. NPDC090075 TaxID=3365937 RepID=UPI0037F77D49
MQEQPAHPYGTPGAPRVAVRGEAHLEVDPEFARIGVTVRARGTDRRGTLADLSRRNALAADLVLGYGNAVERMETSVLAITPELAEHGRRERVRAYHGHVHTTVELTDFSALGELTARLADLDLTDVDGCWWGLRPGSPVHRQCRRAAVHDAVQRAREYASTLDAGLVALVELSDSGLTTGAPSTHDDLFDQMAPRGAGDGFAPEASLAIDLRPERQTVTAHVEAHFIMTPPRL